MIRKTLSGSAVDEATNYSPETVLSGKLSPDHWEKLNRMLFYVIALFLPIGFLPFNIGVEFSREILFSAITAAALLLWLLKVLSSGEFYYRSSFIYFGIGVFILIGILSSFFSVNPLYSIFFSDTIAEKVSTILLGTVLMFLLGSIGREPAYGVKILFVLIFAGVISGIYSLLQFFNFLSLPFDFARGSDFNVIGTVNGLALFYSALLLMCLAIVSSQKGKAALLPRSLNTAFFLAIAIFIFNLLVINYQFAWVAVFFGSVFLTGLQLTLNQSGRLILDKRSVLMFVMVVFSILMILIRTPFFKSVVIPIEVSPSASATINIAKSVFKEGARGLLLGSGPATFGLDFSRYKDPAINTTPFWGLRFNQGFSYVLTVLATEGLLGFLAVIGFLGLLVFAFLKFILEKRSENIFIVPVFAGILTAVLSLFIYRANFSLIIALFFLSGLFFIISGIGERKIEFRTPWLSFIGSMAALFLISLAVFFGYFLEERFRAAIYFQSGLNSFSLGNSSSALSQLEKAALIDYRNDRYFRTLAQARLIEVRNTINKAASSKDTNLQAQFQSQVSSAIGAAQQAVMLNQLDSQNWLTSASVYETVIPFIQGAERFTFDAYGKAIQYDPKNPGIFVNLGRAELIYTDRLSFLMGQPGQPKENIQTLKQAKEAVFEQAIASFSKAIELKSDFTDAHFLLAQTFIRKGDMGEAIRRVENAKILSPFDIGIAFQLGFLYYRSNQFNKAEGEFLRALSLNQNYSNARYFLGLIYARDKDKTKAIDEFEKIRAFNPDNQEIVRILSNLRSGRSALDGIASFLESRDTAPISDKK